MARRNNLVFETKKRSGSGSTRKFWLILIVCVLAVLTVSLAVILKGSDYDVDTAFGFEKETTTEETVSETKPAKFKADRPDPGGRGPYHWAPGW